MQMYNCVCRWDRNALVCLHPRQCSWGNDLDPTSYLSCPSFQNGICLLGLSSRTKWTLCSCRCFACVWGVRGGMKTATSATKDLFLHVSIDSSTASSNRPLHIIDKHWRNSDKNVLPKRQMFLNCFSGILWAIPREWQYHRRLLQPQRDTLSWIQFPFLKIKITWQNTHNQLYSLVLQATDFDTCFFN